MTPYYSVNTKGNLRLKNQYGQYYANTNVYKQITGEERPRYSSFWIGRKNYNNKFNV